MAVKWWFECIKKPAQKAGIWGGETEIRTRDTLLEYTRFPGVPLKPLEHLSNGPFSNRECKDKNFLQFCKD